MGGGGWCLSGRVVLLQASCRRTNMGYPALFSMGQIDPMGLRVIQREFMVVFQTAHYALRGFVTNYLVT